MLQYVKIQKIGKGSHGEVWKVQTRDGYRALKIGYENAIENLKQEKRVLENLRHPAIPSFYGFDCDEQTAYLMMEWMEGVPLTSLRSEMLSEAQILNIARQLLDIIAYVHENNILYLDLKPENILITANKRIQLVDFSCAQYKEEQNPILHYGTHGYAPLEQYIEGYLDERADIYAFGKVMMALSLGIIDGALLDSYCVEDTMRSQAFQDVIRGCVEKDKTLRWQSCRQLEERLIILSSPPQYSYDSHHTAFGKVFLLLILSILVSGCHAYLVL